MPTLALQVTTPTQQQAAAITKSGGNGGRGGGGSSSAVPEESNAVAEVGARLPAATRHLCMRWSYRGLPGLAVVTPCGGDRASP